uniref:Uncharacterized protein n=1 Tax=Anguilla anguilla TaxID=7936 RepID=A0A0E9WQN9_ANGAN
MVKTMETGLSQLGRSLSAELSCEHFGQSQSSITRPLCYIPAETSHFTSLLLTGRVTFSHIVGLLSGFKACVFQRLHFKYLCF